MYICDFCSETPVVTSYPAKSFVSRTVPEVGSEGGWAACSACKLLIDIEEWELLENRSLTTFLDNHGHIIPLDILAAFIHDLHLQFRQNRTTKVA